MTVRKMNWAAMRVGALAVIFVLILSPILSVSAQAWEVVASGLDNPRGLEFGPEGALYVAEAGTGGDQCFEFETPEGSGEVCAGKTGAVTRVYKGEQERIVTGLPSHSSPDEQGFVGNFATGPHDVSFQGRGNGYVVVGLGANPDDRSLFGAMGKYFGLLYRFQPNGKVKAVKDIAAYEKKANPDGGAVDSNPYSVEAIAGKQLIVDAGGNSLLQLSANGKVTTLAVFPNRVVPVPPLPFLPPGTTEWPIQAVPTSVEVGPDGAYYVGQLTGFPFPHGEARVYRIVPGQPPEIYAEGFSAIIDIAFDPDGHLYVLQIARNSLLEAEMSGDFTGALIHVAPDGTRTTIAEEGLVAPGGVTYRDGYLYVTNYSTFAGMGEVVRIPVE